MGLVFGNYVLGSSEGVAANSNPLDANWPNPMFIPNVVPCRDGFVQGLAKLVRIRSVRNTKDHVLNDEDGIP